MYAVVIGNKEWKNLIINCLEDIGFAVTYIDTEENIEINEAQLKKSGIGRADIFLNLTKSDEFNLYFCKKAKIDYNVPITLALANYAENSEVMKLQGIDFVVCTSLFLINFLKNTLFKEILSLHDE